MSLACGGTPSTPSDTGDDIVFLGSTPPPGGTILFDMVDATQSTAVVFSFSIRSPSGEANGLRIELFDAAGHRCGLAEPHFSPLSPSQTQRVDVPFLVLLGEGGCSYPAQTPSVETRTLKATLLRFGPALFTRTFALRYVLTGPAVSPHHTDPEITSAGWTGAVNSGHPAIPAPGSETDFGCTARDRDGDPLAITLALESGGCPTPSHCWSVTQTFGSRLLDTPVQHRVRKPAPSTATTGTFTCTVTSAAGARAMRSVCFTMRGQPPCR